MSETARLPWARAEEAKLAAVGLRSQRDGELATEAETIDLEPEQIRRSPRHIVKRTTGGAAAAGCSLAALAFRGPWAKTQA